MLFLKLLRFGEALTWRIVHGLQTHKKNTLDPKWSNEDFWLLVQEPKTQMLRIQVYDRDNINLKVCETDISMLMPFCEPRL